MKMLRRIFVASTMAMVVSSSLSATDALAQTTPQTSKPIKIGMSFPLSGVSAVLGTNIMAGMEARFELYNADAVGGAKIERLIMDDAYDPARLVSNVRKFVESDEVLAVFGIGGTAHNLAVADYLNAKGTPHLFLNTSDPRFGDSKKYPYSVPFLPSFDTEMATYVKHIMSSKPTAKIGVLYQNDSYGQAGLEALERALTGSGLTLVAKESYLPSDPSVDVQISKLARVNPDVLVNISIPKFAAQAIRRAASLQWKPMHFLQLGSASSELVLKPAGIEESQGIISGAYLKDPADPALANDPGVVEYLKAMKTYKPSVNARDPFVVRGWAMAEAMIATIKGASEPTKDGLMKSARNLNAQGGMMLVPFKTGPDQVFPIGSLVIETFKGERFILDTPVSNQKTPG